MVDRPTAQPSAVANTAKVAAVLAFFPTLMSVLPERIALAVCIVMVTCSAIVASVPAPSKNRLLIALYQLVRVGGLGVKYAVPYMATHLIKSGPEPLPTATAASSNQESSK